MKLGFSGVQLHHRRRVAWVTTVLIGLAGLLAFSPLIGCAGSASTPAARTMIATTPKNQASPWRLVWNDEFSGPAGSLPDPNKWTAQTGGNGWGSKQLEYNTGNLNAYQDGEGNLVVEARKDTLEEFQCWYGPCQYTSARISTGGHFSFTYGRLEARIKIPNGQGSWPAFWLLGSNCAEVGWPTCGEIDVMENIGKKEPATIHGSVHGPENFTRSYTLPQGAFADDFHVFALQWDPGHLYFFEDGVNYATLDKASDLTNQQDWVYNHPFDIILDVAVGGNWPGSPDATTIFPQKMYVSYIRLSTRSYQVGG